MWNEQWSIKVDGYEINDKTAFWTVIPEIDNIGSVDVITVDVPNDYPVYIRTQPLSASITFKINMTPCSWATYRTRLDTIYALMTPGPHTLTIQVRGMATAKSLTFIPQQVTVTDPKARELSVQATIPKPVLA